MKYIVVLVLTFASVLKSHSQTLAGVWEGWFLYTGIRADTVIIKLNFSLQPDSTYSVYSFTKERGSKSVCKMSYKLLSESSIYLEEIEVVRTNKPEMNYKLQHMKLKIGKDFKTMAGRWSCVIKELRWNGPIYFFKKE